MRDDHEPSSDWSPKRPLDCVDRRTANKMVMHLSIARLDKQRSRVDVMARALERAFRALLAALPTERQPWFEDACRAADALRADLEGR